MESWRQCFRDGFLPLLSTEEIVASRELLAADSQRLTQGSTTTPPPLMCVRDWPVECCCFLANIGVMRSGGYCPDDLRSGVMDDEMIAKRSVYATVGKVEEIFAKLCFDADKSLGEPAACRYFLNWYDETPRDEMRREMIAELDRAILERTPADVPLQAAEPETAA